MKSCSGVVTPAGPGVPLPFTSACVLIVWLLRMMQALADLVGVVCT